MAVVDCSVTPMSVGVWQQLSPLPNDWLVSEAPMSDSTLLRESFLSSISNTFFWVIPSWPSFRFLDFDVERILSRLLHCEDCLCNIELLSLSDVPIDSMSDEGVLSICCSLNLRQSPFAGKCEVISLSNWKVSWSPCLSMQSPKAGLNGDTEITRSVAILLCLFLIRHLSLFKCLFTFEQFDSLTQEYLWEPLNGEPTILLIHSPSSGLWRTGYILFIVILFGILHCGLCGLTLHNVSISILAVTVALLFVIKASVVSMLSSLVTDTSPTSVADWTRVGGAIRSMRKSL